MAWRSAATHQMRHRGVTALILQGNTLGTARTNGKWSSSYSNLAPSLKPWFIWNSEVRYDHEMKTANKLSLYAGQMELPKLPL